MKLLKVKKMYFEDNPTIDYVTSLSAISGFMLYNIRRAMGLGQADMGKMFNMSHATYRSIERGETAINADYIFMLCGIIERKFSDYFVLVEDIAEFLIKVEKDAYNAPCEIRLVPNGEFQKMLNLYGTEEQLMAVNTNMPNILHDQDFNLFFSPEIRLKMLTFVDQIKMKDDFKNIVKITSDEVGEVVDALKSIKLNNSELNSSVRTDMTFLAGSASATALLATLVNPLSLPVLTGLALYEAYKKSKEEKKSKK